MRVLFSGSAGTGKTFSLVREAEAFVAEGGLSHPHQKVLGLTFMHGSRARMTYRLGKVTALSNRFRVETLDSFALRLVRRFRGRLGMPERIAPPAKTSEVGPSGWRVKNGVRMGSFPAIRGAATAVLGDPAVAATVHAAYPLVLLDEAQDCEGVLWDLVKALCLCSNIRAAADPFQALSGSKAGDEVVRWFGREGEVRHLTEQHRTSENRILETAQALRKGTRRRGIGVFGVRAYGLGAYEVQRRIRWNGWWGSAALISPARPVNSAFVRQVLGSLPGRKAKGRLGGTPFLWEKSLDRLSDEKAEELMEHVGGASEVSYRMLRGLAKESKHGSLEEKTFAHAARTMRLNGLENLLAGELRAVAKSMARVRRVWKGTADTGRLGMTVHGAKNREFDYVFILWPFQVRGNEEQHRRLLYNAVTRAREDAVIIVHDPNGKRLTEDPVLSAIC